jgi:hypothetical protein
MKNITRSNLTDTVKSSFSNIDDERLNHLVNRLVHHLHAFATETQLTHGEWCEGIAFLHRAAEISDASRSEFTLMSDVLGMSSLVDLMAARPGATEGSVLGPFHTRGSPWVDNGTNLIRDNFISQLLFPLSSYYLTQSISTTTCCSFFFIQSSIEIFNNISRFII